MPLASEMDSQFGFLLVSLLKSDISIWSPVTSHHQSKKIRLRLRGTDLRRKNRWRRNSHDSVLLNLHRSLASKRLFKVHWPQQEPLPPQGDPQNSWRRRNSRYRSQDTSTARDLPLQPTKIHWACKSNFSAKSYPPWMGSSRVSGWDLA